MPRVIGIDPGTVTIDLCGLEDGRVFLDRSFPTGQALADPTTLITLLHQAGPLDLVAGPSGYGLPLTPAAQASEEDLQLAFLARVGEAGGIGGLRTLARALARSGLPVVFTPGVIHLPSVPAHRKVNRVDMGTADKVCAAALAVDQQARRTGRAIDSVSFVLLELGGAFTAAVAVERGQIVDGCGGTSGPLGFRAAGALDGEVAFLAGTISKAMLFSGGAATVAGWKDDAASPDRFGDPSLPREQVAWDAYVESAAKAAAALALSVESRPQFLLSGRLARVDAVQRAISDRLSSVGATSLLDGFAAVTKEAAQGAALIADGLAGGAHKALVDALGIRAARGTSLDHLYFITPGQARERLAGVGARA